VYCSNKVVIVSEKIFRLGPLAANVCTGTFVLSGITNRMLNLNDESRGAFEVVCFEVCNGLIRAQSSILKIDLPQ